MKKVIIFLLVTLMMLFSVFSFAKEVYTEGTLYYTIENESITITGCFSKDESVKVPAIIAGIPVNTIATGAFADNKYVKTIYLPDTITTIEEDAIPTSIDIVLNYNIETDVDTSKESGNNGTTDTSIVDSAETNNNGTTDTSHVNGETNNYNGDTSIDNTESNQNSETSNNDNYPIAEGDVIISDEEWEAQNPTNQNWIVPSIIGTIIVIAAIVVIIILKKKSKK